MKIKFLKCIFLICSLIFVQDLFSQTLVEIELNKTVGNFPFKESYIGTRIIVDSPLYEIPEKYKDYIIKKFQINNRYDNSNFSLLGEKVDYLAILININLDSSRTLIVDLNNNKDFNDENPLRFSKNKSNDNNLNFFNLTFNYKYKLVDFYFQTITYPSYLKYNDLNEQAHYLLISSYENYSGNIKIGKDMHQIFIKNSLTSPYYHLKNLEIALKDDAGNYTFYNPNEVIEIGENKIVLDSISITGEKLFVKLFNKDAEFKEYGFSKQFYLKSLELIDFNNKRIIIPTNNKYTLIDFWGTWCAPCLELTPKLLALNNKYKNDLNIISIAGNSKIKDVVNYTTKNKINWTQIVENEINKDIFGSKLFAINAYPTFILIDQNGKIILRGTGAKALDKVENLIAK
jgi:thiol-disulfide isomerase/thioredoxin